MLVEVCCDTILSISVVNATRADRIELCSAISLGGLTPSLGLISQACRLLSDGKKLHVLLRPRPGDFCYNDHEVEIMKNDLLYASNLGVHGFAFGFLDSKSTVDIDKTRYFADLCNSLGLDFTFHRAFDVVKDQTKALDDLIGCKVRRVLTSGGKITALEGVDQISKLVRQAQEGTIKVMAGAGVTEYNAATIVKSTGITEIHGTFKCRMPSAMALNTASPLDVLGETTDSVYTVDAERVNRVADLTTHDIME